MSMDAYSSVDITTNPNGKTIMEDMPDAFTCFPVGFLVNYLLPLQLGYSPTPRRTELFLTARGL